MLLFKKSIVANLITISRIVLAIILLIFNFENKMFLILYTICAITDILDGFVARKLKIESEFGSKLDSIADMFLAVVVIKKVYPAILSQQIYLVWTTGVGILKLLSISIVLIKYNKFAILHTYLNKITGFSIFLLLYFISFSNIKIFIYMILTIATSAAVEELYINLKSKELNVNKKTIL